mmetsp:Transcript_35262/g.46728  ORF Transcript_35262/g.46728 Transcript_35262/m.46728 type:complete len:81 (+) Transcript_35262:25-267(+)
METWINKILETNVVTQMNSTWVAQESEKEQILFLLTTAKQPPLYSLQYSTAKNKQKENAWIDKVPLIWLQLLVYSSMDWL